MNSTPPPPSTPAPGSHGSSVDLDEFLASAAIASSVFDLRPDYRAILIAVDGLRSPTTPGSVDAIVLAAEAHARALLQSSPVEDLPHVSAWRDAYRGFGAKPQRTRNSLEALMRRAASGLPRVNHLTDVYNAISVLHQLPIGGEDLGAYRGAPRLLRAQGTEPFDTYADGRNVTEHPDPGEVIWRDDVGVTCRRWNWRQARRTRLHDETVSALFILDALQPISDGELQNAASALIEQLAVSAGVRVSARLVRADPAEPGAVHA